MEINNFIDNSNIEIKEEIGSFQIIEHKADLSVMPNEAVSAYFSSKMNVRRRQALYYLNGQNSVILSAGAMQWMAGDVRLNNNVQGVGDFMGKMFAGKVTGESAIKPVYYGDGIVCTEPTYKHLLIEDLSKGWNGGIVMDDGLFLAADGNLQQKLFRKRFSAAVTQNMDFFNMSLVGNGLVLLESLVARPEIIEVILNNEQIIVDGDLVIAWSPSIDLTVEPITRRRGSGIGGLISSGISSAASGEGLVNVFRGTGKLLLAPTI